MKLEPKGHGIGASEVWTIFGVNPYETPQELYLRKLGQIEKEPSTPEMEAGNRGEWFANEIFKRDYLKQYDGYTYFYQPIIQGVKRSDKYPGLVCKPDGILVHPDGRIIIIEYKTVEDMTAIEYKGRKPDNWLYQDYAQMECYGASEVHCYVFIKRDLTLVPLPPVEARPDFQQKIGEACTRFWNAILNNTPPAAPEQEVIERLDTSKFLETMSVDQSSFASIARQLWSKRSQKTALEKEVKSLNDQLVNYMAELGTNKLVNRGTVTTLVHNSGEQRFDWKTFITEHPEFSEDKLKKYLHSSPSVWAKTEVVYAE